MTICRWVFSLDAYPFDVEFELEFEFEFKLKLKFKANIS
jgi:hypothetical protein